MFRLRASKTWALKTRALRITSVLVLALLAAPHAVGAASAPAEFVIVTQPGVNPALARTVHLAAERCIPLYAGYVGTRLSRRITIHIYPTKEAFVRGRQVLGGESLEEALRAADYLGSAIGYTILINQAQTHGTAEQAGTTCHEIVHVYQVELGTEDARPGHEWMLEGYAYYMEKVALEHLGLETLAAALDHAVKALRETPDIDLRTAVAGGLLGALAGVPVTGGTGRVFPRLADIASQAQFDAAGERFGSGFGRYLILMMDFLLKGSSHSAFVAYFRSFAPNAGTPDREENFRAAFRMTVVEFQARLDVHLTAVTR